MFFLFDLVQLFKHNLLMKLLKTRYHVEPHTSPACPVQRSYKRNERQNIQCPIRDSTSPSNLFVLAIPALPPPPPPPRPFRKRPAPNASHNKRLAGWIGNCRRGEGLLPADILPTTCSRRPVTHTLVPARRRPVARRVPDTAWDIGVAPPACGRHDAVKTWCYSSSSSTTPPPLCTTRKGRNNARLAAKS